MRAHPFPRRALAAMSAIGFACSSSSSSAPSASASVEGPKSKVIEAADNEDVDSKSNAKASDQAIVAIPAGKFESGSTPGDKGRNPITEPALVVVDLGAFDIDRSPWPNELDKPPLVNVSRDRAAELCKSRGRRLCTELEWERACKGPDDDVYAGRAAWDPACAKDPSSCASNFGVVGMGSIREIVAGEIGEVKDLLAAGPVVRGAAPSAPATDHRCARRSPVGASASADDLGFRCCGGPQNLATIAAPPWKQTFTKVELSTDKLRELFSTVPQLRKLGDSLKYFDEEGAKRVIQRSDAGDVPKGITLTTMPLAWSPVPGEDLLVVTGQAGDDSFIVAFYQLPEDRYRVGSTMIFHKEKGPIVLGFNGYDGRRQKDKARASLDWATCWKCLGESGLVTYKEDGRVTITQE
ncbi:MAG: SUMF1/EgtB/PvdO family nonheme iron enzyme [Polyangiaceae bacterium]